MKYVRRVKAKGREYWYYRRGGRNVERLPSPEDKRFHREYTRINEQYEGREVEISHALPGSVRELAEKYLSSPQYRKLSQNSQGMYRRYADLMIRLLGDEDRNAVKQSTILALRDGMADTPGKANEFVKVARIIFGWGKPRDLVQVNPANFRDTDVRPLPLGEHRPWPEPLIQKCLNEADDEVAWVLTGLLCAGQRIGDTLKMGLADLGGDGIEVVQEKTGKRLWIPLHPDFKALLEVIPRRSTRIFTSPTGRVWTYDNFRHRWLANRDRLGAKGYTLHGLRKNAVIRLRQAGCSVEEAGAITGQCDEMVKYYSKEFDQSMLAETAMKKLESWERTS